MTDPSPEEIPVREGQIERYKFTVSYNGSAYYGFQIQGRQKTVQLELENVLKKLGWKERSIIGAGRTDTGVHAAGQVFSAGLDWSHGTEALMAAMNAKLPDDIAIRDVKKVSDSFHARFDATSRCYHYELYFSKVRDPLRDPFYWKVFPRPDLDLLNEISKRFIGVHDFKAFGSPPRKDRGTVREIKESYWLSNGADQATYVIRANAFLYHMVRRILYVQLACASGRIDLSQIEAAVQYGTALKPGLAPPNGLRLWEVTY